MRKTLESFFHGNIRPSENQMTPNSELQRAVDKAARSEKRLSEQLGEPEKVILTELVQAQHEIDSITACEHFIMGFRLGVRMMAECMDENDGDIQEISEHRYQQLYQRLYGNCRLQRHCEPHQPE